MTTTDSRPTTEPEGGPTPTAAPVSAPVTERDARKVAEAARETEWHKPSFGKQLFLGRLQLDLIDPWPQSDPAYAEKGRVFLETGIAENAANGIDGPLVSVHRATSTNGGPSGSGAPARARA